MSLDATRSPSLGSTSSAQSSQLGRHAEFAALEALRSLFETDLASVPFPDVNAGSLGEAAGAVEEARLAVAVAEAALRGARDAQEQAREAYERLGRRGLAYARIYAEGDAALGEQLVAIARGLEGPRNESQAEAPRKRGRPRKVDSSLFDVDSAGPSTAASRAPRVEESEDLAEASAETEMLESGSEIEAHAEAPTLLAVGA